MTPQSDKTPYSCIVAGRKLKVYADDHPPPHCHVFANFDEGGTIRVNLDSGERFSGDEMNRAAVREWPKIQKAIIVLLPVLVAAWQRLNPRIHGGQP